MLLAAVMLGCNDELPKMFYWCIPSEEPLQRRCFATEEQCERLRRGFEVERACEYRPKVAHYTDHFGEIWHFSDMSACEKDARVEKDAQRRVDECMVF